MIVDIAFNITDCMYDGIYNDTKKHENDVHNVLRRSYDNSIAPFFMGSNYSTSKKSLEYAKKYNTYCYIGIHPNDASKYKDDLESIRELIYSCNKKNNDIIKDNNISFFSKPIANNFIAVGECGLDYYRKTSTVNDQKHVFKYLLDLKEERYFLHSRDAHRDMMEMLCDYNINAVVHSFDGTVEEAEELIKKGYYIGVNGHSFKKNCHVISEINSDRILLESDAPYCKVGKTYEGYKYIKTFFEESKKYAETKIYKRRNEPVNTIQILEILSEIKNINLTDMKNIITNNTIRFFGDLY